HDRDALACRGVQVNVVHPDSGSADHAKLAGIRKQVSVYLNGGTHNQGVGGLQLRSQVAVDLVRCDDGPTRLMQQVNSGSGDFFGNNNLHKDSRTMCPAASITDVIPIE